jgi:peptide/nickel transport system substrate-binding protein
MSNFDKLKDLAMSGRLSRREFIGYAAALGVTAAVADPIYLRAARAAPTRGGSVTIGHAHGSTTDSLDPGTWENDFVIELSFAVNNFLTEISADGSIKGELAESWEASDDAAQWTFQLRKGVTFHNGKDVTAADVVASFNHHRGEASESAAKPIVSSITDIQADGDSVVVFTLNGGNADFPFLVSDYHLNILPAADGVVDWRSGVGTGGYSLVEFEPGVRTTLKRNPNYFKQGRAHFDEADVLSIVDVTARTNAMTSGEVDAIDRVDLKTAHLFAERPGIMLNETSGTLHYSYSMRCDTAPFDDPNVRLALKYAIDREAMLHTLLRGHGYLGNDHPIGRSNRYFAAELE